MLQLYPPPAAEAATAARPHTARLHVHIDRNAAPGNLLGALARLVLARARRKLADEAAWPYTWHLAAWLCGPFPSTN